MKKRLLERFLTQWAKDTVMRDNRRLVRKNRELEQKISMLERYVAGLQDGIRAAKRISIYNKGGSQ